MQGRFGNLKIFSGNANKLLTEKICEYLHEKPGKIEVFKFRNDNSFVRILENVREHDVFLVQPTSGDVNDSIMELLIMIDAARRASAARVTAVMPYYGYGRTDKKDQPRVPITARLIADLISTAGADRVITVDLHAAQIQGFFNIPVDELTAVQMFADYFLTKSFENIVVIATDVGISKDARDFAERLKAPLAIVEKRRVGNDDNVQTLNIIGDVKDKIAITFDDEIDTGGSLIQALAALEDQGAKEVYSCATHAVFSNGALERLSAHSILKELIVTDTITQKSSSGKLKVLSIAPLLGEAISRIQTGRSVGALFKK